MSGRRSNNASNTYQSVSSDVDHSIIPRWRSKWNGSNDPFSKLLKLDSFVKPGLTQKEFEGLLTRCQHCKLIMTKRRIDSHECMGTVMKMRVVIDLTQD